MNRKAATLLTLIFSTLIIFSCSSLGRQEQPAGENTGPDLSTVNSGPVMPGGWKYETEITHEGSRSEGSVSRLFYRYNEIPGVFTRIVIGRNLFEYKSMVNIWDKSGYILTASDAAPAVAEKELISSAELKRGWYESFDGLLKKSTPPEWIFVETTDLSLWVSPEKIYDMIKIYNFRPISQALIPEPANERTNP